MTAYTATIYETVPLSETCTGHASVVSKLTETVLLSERVQGTAAVVLSPLVETVPLADFVLPAHPGGNIYSAAVYESVSLSEYLVPAPAGGHFFSATFYEMVSLSETLVARGVQSVSIIEKVPLSEILRILSIVTPPTGTVTLAATGYTISGATVTLSSPPVPSQQPLVSYTYGSGAQTVTGEVPGGAVDGSNTAFTVSHTPDGGSVSVSLQCQSYWQLVPRGTTTSTLHRAKSKARPDGTFPDDRLYKTGSVKKTVTLSLGSASVMDINTAQTMERLTALLGNQQTGFVLPDGQTITGIVVSVSSQTLTGATGPGGVAYRRPLSLELYIPV